jgi:protease-4
MSSSAASGGYYIACEADTIVASPATVTGSIGVISSWLNFSTLYERVGITTDSLKRGNNSLYFSMQHLLSDGERKKLEESTEEVYQTFKNKVLEGRNLDPSFDLDKDIAMGRIFTGLRAKRSHNNILVDTTGYLFDEVAINIAKESANVDGEIKIVEFPRSKDGIEVVAEVISSKLSSLLNTKKQENKARPGELLLKDVYNEFDELYTMALIMDNNKVQCIMPIKIRIE